MNLKFNNSKFKIMQIADIQEKVPLNPDTVKLIDLALQREKPDLVVLTGDQVQGYSACYREDAEKKAEICIDSFLEPIVKRNIPFCFTFGNHDDDCRVSKEKQLEFYAKHKSCVVPHEADRLDEGTYTLRIKSSDESKDVLALYLIDTGKKNSDGVYEPLKKERIEWLSAIREKNGYIPAMVFQHIPCPEFYDVIKKVPHYKPRAVEGFRSRKGYYILEKPQKGEFMRENPASPEVNNGQFEEILKHDDIFALYVGHDHNNSFKRKFKGVDLGYTQGAGFNTYGPGKNRGVRIFLLDENNIKGYETYTVTMGELCRYIPAKPLKEFALSHSPSSIEQALSIAKKIALVGGVAALGIAIIKKIR